MSKDTNGSVREARMEAKKITRNGEITHQQALDQVARDRGHRNWSAFLSSEGEGGVRGASPRVQAPRVATKRDVEEEIETRFLEDAAYLKEEHPSWPLRLTPVLGGAWWLFLLLLSVAPPLHTVAAMCTYLVLTIASGRIAQFSPDGFLAARRRITTAGMIVGVGLVVLAAGLAAYGLAYYGHHHVMGSAFNHPLFDRANLAYVAAVTTLITSQRIHRTMTVAVPDSVRPASREDIAIYDAPTVERPRLLRALVVGLFGGTGMAALGVVVLIGTTIAFLISRELSMTAFGVAFGGIALGVVVAMMSMVVIMYLMRGDEHPASAARHRASRAKRFLKAAARNSQPA